MTMSSVDLPEPLGPTTAIASPAGTLEVDAAQDGDGAGARGQRDMHIFEPDCRVATLFQSVIHGRGAIEIFCATASLLERSD